MSNSLKIKKPKNKDKEAKKSAEIQTPKYGAKFMNQGNGKAFSASNYSGKSTKSFSRKKT